MVLATVYLAAFMCLGVFGLFTLIRLLWTRWDRASAAFVIPSAIALGFFIVAAVRVVLAGVQVVIARGLS